MEEFKKFFVALFVWTSAVLIDICFGPGADKKVSEVLDEWIGEGF